MTKEQYISVTQRTKSAASRLPFGAKAFSIPTYLLRFPSERFVCSSPSGTVASSGQHWFRREFSCW